jgi:hypothetical protein
MNESAAKRCCLVVEKKQVFLQREKTFALDMIQRKYWSMDDVFYSHKGFGITPSAYHSLHKLSQLRNDPDPSFYRKVNPNARQNPTNGYLSLHRVHSAEFDEVMAMAQTDSNFSGTIAVILRVQNYALMDTFNRFGRQSATTNNLGVGFHASNNFKYVENILLNDLNPGISTWGKLGRGSYLASNATYSLDGYAGTFKTPLHMDSRGQQCIDEYKIVILFCLNKGNTKINEEGTVNAMLPSGYGAFVDQLDNPNIYCFQEFERTYPAYIMVYRLQRNQYNMMMDIEMAVEHNGAKVDMSGKWAWPSDTVGLSVFAHAINLPLDDG